MDVSACLATWRTSVQRDREGANLDLQMLFQLSSRHLALPCTIRLWLQFVLSVGSGAPVFIAEYDPFCALQAYIEGMQALCPISTSLFLQRVTLTSNLTPREEDEEQRVRWKYRTL